MSALFALCLLVVPARAVVVMPVENGVAPSGPSAPAVPVLSPVGGTSIMPSLGGLDLHGGLPLLPSPVPGLMGSALHFVGNAPEAAAVQPAPGATQTTASPKAVAPGRAADKTPALPAKPVPGGTTLAISRDRKSAASLPDNGSALSRIGGDEASVEPALREATHPEKAAGLGRKFFDQSADKNRGTLEDPGSSVNPSPIIAATILSGGAFGPGGGGSSRLSPRNSGSAFAAGHGPSQDVPSYSPEGETLHDAVASVVPLPAAMAPGGPAASAYFGSVLPNGQPGAPSGVSGSAVLALPGAPRPLSLDLSRSGLIVRVRSALNGVMGAPVQSPASIANIVAPGPSTALLERGGMLEAFSVARAYADGSAVKSVSTGSDESVVRRAKGAFSRGLEMPAEPAQAPLWWALFVLPLFVAAIRSL